MVQRTEVLTPKPADLTPGAHMVEGENRLLQIIIQPLFVHWHMCIHTYM